jgi:hypothetical protein
MNSLKGKTSYISETGGVIHKMVSSIYISRSRVGDDV